jgi:hypothetical protein
VTEGARERGRGVGGTSTRAASWLAWSLLALVLLILALGLILWSPDAGFFLTFALIAALFAVVGALVASRRPRNPIGWLFLAFAVVAVFVASADQYAVYALVEHPGSLPGGDWVAWLASGIWHPAFGFFVFAFLLFPDGRLPSARWRPVARIAAANYLMGGVMGYCGGRCSRNSSRMPNLRSGCRATTLPVWRSSFSSSSTSACSRCRLSR